MSSSARRASLLQGLWLVIVVIGALPGLLLAAFAEDTPARVAAGLLLGCAVLAGAGVVAAGHGSLRTSLGLSALLLVAAVAALVVLSWNGHVSVKGVLLLGGIPIAGALLTALVAARLNHLRDSAG